MGTVCVIYSDDDIQDDAELEASKYTISVSVISPKKVGDGVGAYMVYKVVTKVSHLKFFTFLSHLSKKNFQSTLLIDLRSYVHTYIRQLIMCSTVKHSSIGGAGIR